MNNKGKLRVKLSEQVLDSSSKYWGDGVIFQFSEQIQWTSSNFTGHGAIFHVSEQIEWRWSNSKVQWANPVEMEQFSMSVSKSSEDGAIPGFNEQIQ